MLCVDRDLAPVCWCVTGDWCVLWH